MKKFPENFLELRKHPSCIALAILGWCDILVFVSIVFGFSVGGQFIFWLLAIYVENFRISCLIYYMAITLVLFILEKKNNLSFKNNFFNSKIYKIMWLIGIIVFIGATIIYLWK